MKVNEILKIAICDDDPTELKRILSMLSEYLDINNYLADINTYSSGEEFLSSDVKKYQLVVLDIFMGDINGIDTAKKLMELHPECKIIFCSTSNAYASESYDVNALRYLNKPLEIETMRSICDRYGGMMEYNWDDNSFNYDGNSRITVRCDKN